MAANEESTRVHRRDVLRTGALALGAALLPCAAGAAPPPTPADLIAAVKAAYARTIARLTDELEPRIRSGELRGWRSGDDDAADELWERQLEADPQAPRPELPHHLLERELRARLARTHDEAAFVLLASGGTVEERSAVDLRYDAGETAAKDVLREALRRGVYPADPDEARALLAPSARVEDVTPVEELQG